VAVVAGIAALTTALFFLGNEVEKARIEKLNDQLGDLEEEFDRAAGSEESFLKRTNEAAKAMDNFLSSAETKTLTNVQENIAAIAEEFGVSEVAVVDASLALNNYGDGINDLVEQSRGFAEQEEQIWQEEETRLEEIEKVKVDALAREEARRQTAILNEQIAQATAEQNELQRIAAEEQAREEAAAKEIQDKKDLIQALDDLDTENAEQIYNDFQERQARMDEARQVAADLAIGLVNQIAASSSAAFEQEIDEIEDKVERGVLAEEEGAKEIAKIKREQAVQSRAVATFNAILNTAIGVTKALTDYPFPYSAIIGGLVGAAGAVEIATINSAPLPKLAEGGFFNGPALIGEAGREFAFPLDGPQGQNAMGLMADKLTSAMGGNTNNSNITFNSTFDLGNEATKRKAARDLFPFMIEEQKRRGIA